MDLSSHPCFNNQARLRYSRVHLPVAPACNVQCNYCDRKFDCANESRPGVCSALLTPTQAADYVDAVLAQDPSLRVVGIAGPGDPLANASRSLETLRLVRRRHPDMLLCLATNGLALPRHAESLAALKVSHVTVTVNAIDPEVGARFYAWVTDNGERLQGLEAAKRLLDAQRLGIRRLVELGVMVKINSILVPGFNDEHIVDVAREMAALGAERFNCLPLYPVPTTAFGHIPAPAAALLNEKRKDAGEFLPQMEHCARCRADAVGRIGETTTEEQLVLLRRHARGEATPKRSHIAVGSQEGLLVNQHLGEVKTFRIFARRGEEFVQIDERAAPEQGTGESRWQELGQLLSDCKALLVADAGNAPKKALQANGIDVFVTEGLIEDLLEALEEGTPLPRQRPTGFRCGKGATCGGNGLMCG